MSNGYVVRIVAGPSIGSAAAVDLPIVVGREGDLVVADPTVSRKHLRIEPGAGGVAVSDLGSSAGVTVNGRPERSADVSPGDLVTLGRSVLRVLRLVRYSDAAAGPALRIHHHDKERVVALHDGSTIGRDAACDVRIEDPTVSRRHAVVHLAGAAVTIEDLGSANGTRVAGRAVRGATNLHDGVAVEVGTCSARLTFSEGAPAGAVSIRVSAEGSTHADTVTVDASAEATVAQVTRELARVVDVPDHALLLYRADDGALLHPDDRWCATGLRPGDEYVLGVGDASSYTAAPGRHWAERATTTLNQLPRTVWPEPAYVVERIDPPESTSFRGRGIVWQVAGGLGAMLIGLMLVVVNPSYAVFGIITGGIGIISIAASILGDQSRRRHKVDEFRRKVAELDAELGRARSRQSTALHALSPSVEELESWVRTASPRIWERRPSDPDALRPTIGTGRRRTRVEVERARASDSPLTPELDDVLARHRELSAVPVTAPGPDTGSLGITGDPDHVRALLARMVVEAAVLHPPTQLRIWVAAAGPGWEWCSWLPHVAGGGPSSDAGEASALLAAARRELVEGGPGGSDVLHLIVVPDPTRRVDTATLGGMPRGRHLVVVGSPDRRDLPSGLAVVLDIHGDGRSSVAGNYGDAPVGDVFVDGIGEDRAERLAIALGRLGGGQARSAPSGLVELLGLGSATNPDVLAAWKQPPTDRLTVAVGSDDAGLPVTVGFRRDGPHGMVAGTTGSGKSELLQTILAALALRHAPDRLNLFLIDFKGGSTFAPLASLPHVVGLVTDLEHDSSLATRALTALDAEIDRRKRLLDAARVPDVIAYDRALGLADPPLPDLLVVIDEFALLMERQPEVRERLDTVATQGRSLGIHLLLATQSPSGVISHAIRTNTNLWICLRVVTESESMEILGTRDAARIPDGSPGRAIIRLGAGQDLRTFQAARIARPVPDEESPVRVTRIGGGPPTAQVAVAHSTELDVVVARLRATATELGLGNTTTLWLPPLPADLPAEQVACPDRPTDRLTVLVGLADHPRQHAQVPFVFDLSSSGHALVAGVFGAGKTTALGQIAADLAQHHSAVDVHVYGIDGGSGSLGPLLALPHVGDIVGVSDVERLTRLIDRLTRAVSTRRDQLAVAGSGDFLRWRAAGGDAPWIVLLVDDYASFREVAEQVEAGRLLERFNSLLQNGPAVGIHVVLATAQATDLRSREINLVLGRLLLRAADSAEYALVDARYAPNEAPRLVPGRGLTTGPVEVQVARPSLTDVAERLSTTPPGDPARLPRRVSRLPVTVSRDDLVARDRELLLGVGGPDVDPVGVPTDGGSTILLVAGPSQSGRSTTLATLMASIGAEPASVLVVAPRPGPLRELATSGGLTLQTTAAGLDDALDEFARRPGPARLLVLDDAEAISSAPGVGPRLEQLLRDAPEAGTNVLVAARVNDLPGMFDPWARYLTSLRRAVLLSPSVDDAFLFGVKLPVIPPPAVAGRGLLIDRSRLTVVQVALPAGVGVEELEGSR